MRGGHFMKYRRGLLLVGLTVLIGCCCSLAESFATRVSDSSDDAKAYGSNMETTSSDALIGYTGYYRCDFLARFTGVMVPPGIQVDSAFMVLRTSSSQSGMVCSGKVCAEDTSAAHAFSNYADYASRLIGDSAVDWSDLPPFSAGDWVRTPDIGSVVAEIVGRPDWVEGNPLAIFVCDDNSSSGALRRFSQIDASINYACSLLVYYSTPPVTQSTILRRRRIVE